MFDFYWAEILECKQLKEAKMHLIKYATSADNGFSNGVMDGCMKLLTEVNMTYIWKRKKLMIRYKSENDLILWGVICK